MVSPECWRFSSTNLTRRAEFTVSSAIPWAVRPSLQTGIIPRKCGTPRLPNSPAETRSLVLTSIPFRVSGWVLLIL